MQSMSGLVGLPGTFEEYIWQLVVPTVMMVLLVLLLWFQLRKIVEYITRGLLEHGDEMPSGNELWMKIYRSYLRHPHLCLWFLRLEILLSFTLAGVAAGWCGPYCVYPPSVFVFVVLGVMMALWAVPSSLFQDLNGGDK